MGALLEKAIAALARQPATEQDAIARELLERLESDARRERLLADPRSTSVLARLVENARSEVAAGHVGDGDPGTRQAE